MDVRALIEWAAKKVGSRDPEQVAAKLSCEGLPYAEVPRGAQAAVVAFRHLSSPARMQKVKSVFKGNQS